MDFSDTPPIVPNCLLDRCADPDPETGPVAPAGPRTMALGLTRGYASAWKVPDALRELYQNWKDAILQAHPEISLLNFEPKYSVTKDKNVITFVVERPPSVEPVITGPSSVLGFIRFDVLQGRAEFANLGTTLGENCLELGHSTKTGDDGRLAGGHGEGLKLAALVLSRHGHHVRISTNGCHWTFNFNGSKKSNFYCRIAPSKAKREAAPSGPPAEAAKLTASVWEDVCVTIDGTSKGQRLAYTDFCAWVQRTVDLHPSVHRIRTTAGELLLNPEHQGQVYLKGIRVNHQSLDTRAFHCGYVLAHGRVDRDRQRLVDPLQARESIHAIWQEAIHKDEARALPRYLELLLTHPSSADVAGAGQQVPERTARKLWGLLRQRAERENTFFCSQARQHADAFLIQSELQKEPRALPDLLWDALRRYGLLRDPLEELRHRLQNADAIQVPQTAVAQGVARTLRALLALSTSTARTQIVFVRCETHAVDVAYQPDRYRLYIHERWLHTPPETPCGAHSSGRSALLWPQIAEELYHRAMMIITSPSGASARLSDAVLRARLQRAHQKLREMPRLIRHQQTAEGQVVSFATGHGLDYVELCSTQVYYLVVLHHVGCPATGSLLYDPGRDTCPCPRQVTALGTRKATFSGLGDRSWVPMICKAQGLHGEDTDSCVPADLQGEGGALIGSSFTTLPPPPASGQPHSVDGRPPRLWTPQDGAVPSSNDCQKGPVGEHSQWAPNPVDKTVNKPPTPSLDECRLQSPPYGHHAGHERMSQSIESVGGAVRMPANSTEGLAAEPVAEPRAAYAEKQVSGSLDTSVANNFDQCTDRRAAAASNDLCREHTNEPGHESRPQSAEELIDNSANEPVTDDGQMRDHVIIDDDDTKHANLLQAANHPTIIVTMHSVDGSVIRPGPRHTGNADPENEISNGVPQTSVAVGQSSRGRADLSLRPQGTDTDASINCSGHEQLGQPMGIDNGCVDLPAVLALAETPLDSGCTFATPTDGKDHPAEQPGTRTPSTVVSPTNPREICENEVWWKDGWEQMHQPAIIEDVAHSVQTVEALRRCQPRKGTFANVTLPDRSHGGKSGRWVFYVHDILEPALGGDTGPRLLVTKYSHLADHPTLGVASAREGDRELLLHWKDVDQMGQRDDAELIDASDVVMAERKDGDPSVSCTVIPPCADIPAVGYFARFGVRDAAQPGPLFVTALQPVPAAAGQPPRPRFAPLPAPTVIDLTPGHVDLAVGFEKAGYRIRAAIGFDEHRHQAWREQHPNAEVYAGPLASSLAQWDAQGTTLTAQESIVPRVATLSGRAEDLITKSDEPTSGSNGLAVPAGDATDIWQICGLLAQSPAARPDFVVVTVIGVASSQIAGPAVGAAVRVLLEAGYSVTVRTMPIHSAGDSDDTAALVLLASPRGTKPQWIDETLSDLHPAMTEGGCVARKHRAKAAASGRSEGTDTVNPPTATVDEPAQGAQAAQPRMFEDAVAHAAKPVDGCVVDTARRIATVVTRIIGEFGKGVQPPKDGPRPIIADTERDRGKRVRVNTDPVMVTGRQTDTN